MERATPISAWPRRARPRQLPRARRRGRSRGQSLVEFALVAPIFFLLIFGIIEFSLINASIGALNFAAKDAARLGSLLGRSDANADSEMLAVIRSHVVGIVPATIQKVEIFRSDEQGDSPTSVEDVYDANGNAIGALNWPPNLRNDDLADADYLGVQITYTYTYLTGFIAGAGTNLTLTALSVQRIEPQDYQGNVATQSPVALRDLLSGPPSKLMPADRWKEGLV